ncbi:hypothetical protein BTN50_0566 [Candidatus Enterovibrio altilux]|uniref:Uncharacterized protein n=1 Tax=Candidatus Enterovibrio altilux TaxID=1927128 RepID=A0A291B7X0_9GAMM|nr:hypothetical protein BTN50_0566 [Candidatus Enterovibrio luxaltus]
MVLISIKKRGMITMNVPYKRQQCLESKNFQTDIELQGS